MISLCTILLDISLPGVRSLKEKRSIVKPIILKMRRKFNISVAEVEYQDIWNRSLLLCAIASNNNRFSQQQAMKIIDFFENEFKTVILLSHKIEFL